MKIESLSKLEERDFGKYCLIGVGLTFLFVIVLLPLINIFYQAFAKGLVVYWQSISDPEAVHAIFVTLLATLVAVPINTAFGVATAWVLARHAIPGKAFILGVLDLPLAISPTVAGLMVVLLYSHTDGIFGRWLEAADIKVVFALPGIILTTVFVTVPFVAREVLPVFQEMGNEEEEASYTLGASSWQTFWQVVFPSIRWAMLYGVILCTARALGEFGAVSVVSGKLVGQTNTLTLHIEQAYEYEPVAAFACASLLAVIAILTLVAQEVLRNTGTGQGIPKSR